MALRDAVDHREAETGAALALGGEERLEAAAARLLVHADAGVAHLDAARAAPAAAVDGRVRSVSASTVGHRVDRVEDEIDQRLADLAFDGHRPRQSPRRVDAHLDDRRRAAAPCRSSARA